MFESISKFELKTNNERVIGIFEKWWHNYIFMFYFKYFYRLNATLVY